MPRHMSFSMTTQAVRDQTKTVTRRLGWWNLKPGDILWACEKCQGLKRGEKVNKLALIRVVGVTVGSRLDDIACMSPAGQLAETAREGFPDLTGLQFVAMFCAANRCAPDTRVNRIEFEYIEEAVVYD